MGLGKVLTFPFRAAGDGAEAVWDLFTVDDEERARKEEKRRQRGLESGGRPSDEDFYEEAKRRMNIIERARAMGIEPGVLIEAEMLEQRERENTLNTLKVMDEIAANKRQEKAIEMAELQRAVELQNQRRTAQPGLGSPQGWSAQVEMPRRNY